MSNKANNDKADSKKPKFNYYWIYGLILVGIIVMQLMPSQNTATSINQEKFLREMLTSGDVGDLVVVNRERVEVYLTEEALAKPIYEEVSKTPLMGRKNPGPHYTFSVGSIENFENRLADAKSKKIAALQQEVNKAGNSDTGKKLQKELESTSMLGPKYVTREDWLSNTIAWTLPFLILIAVWLFIMRRVSGGVGGGGGQIFNIGKSKATLFDKDSKVNVSFEDVAGLEEAKEEVMEIVDFLKNPQKYTALGGKIPKGCLLVGPPGTGKTLIAKAMAGEAQVPFFSISGSDFVELFVGVGASRVRDLFKQAREKAPCIVFIDEIDAIGRARGRNTVQGNDERENTLNQLLVEMDGFSSEKGVIILAASNRPDVLDSALLRPGRFDRQIGVDKPDLSGREKIFEVHIKPLTVVTDIDVKKLAEQTAGFAGADIANVCNEAALIAARRDKKQIDNQDFQDAIDRVLGGLEKKNKIIAPHEKEIIAYHEAGHAVSGWFLQHAHPLLKVTIIPRGTAALGYAQYVPKEQYLYNKDQLMDEICMTLGGRAAEEVIYGKVSTGAQNDLEKITKMCYAMVTIYGMNDKVGNVSFHDPQNEYGFQKPYSDETATMIDEEVRSIIDNAYERTKALLREKKEALETIAQELIKREVLFRADLVSLIGERPFSEPGTPKLSMNVQVDK